MVINSKKNNKLTINTYISLEKINPVFYKNHVPKPMLVTKMLQLIDGKPDNFKDWGVKIIV